MEQPVEIDVIIAQRIGKSPQLLQGRRFQECSPSRMMSAFATELTIDPDLPCELEGFVKPEAVILSKGGVHARLQRKEAQQMGGEAVHRSDLRFFQIAQCRLGACRNVV